MLDERDECAIELRTLEVRRPRRQSYRVLVFPP
jgi:hypothetical protein